MRQLCAAFYWECSPYYGWPCYSCFLRRALINGSEHKVSRRRSLQPMWARIEYDARTRLAVNSKSRLDFAMERNHAKPTVCLSHFRRHCALLKRITPLLVAGSLLVGCVHITERTAANGIEYGMSEDQVAAHLEHSQKIVFRDDAKIVSEGYDRFWGAKRRNIFTFQDGKLAVHQNVPIGD